MNLDDLISCIFVKNALWDQKDAQHHNRYVLDKLWDTVAVEMNSTKATVRAKWKTLRDTYRKELSKIPIKRSGDGASQRTQSPWQYFETLSFLKDQFTARTSGGNLPKSVSQVCGTDTEVTEEREQDADDVVSETQLEAEVIPELVTTPTTAPTLTHKKGIKRKQNDDIGTALIRIEESKIQMLQSQETKTIDEDSSFFNSLLPHVKTLPSGKKMLLRMKIQELVYHFVYGNECQNIPNVSHVQESSFPTQAHPRSHENELQFTHLQNRPQEYSNPTSIASYVSNFSDESFH